MSSSRSKKPSTSSSKDKPGGGGASDSSSKDRTSGSSSRDKPSGSKDKTSDSSSRDKPSGSRTSGSSSRDKPSSSSRTSGSSSRDKPSGSRTSGSSSRDKPSGSRTSGSSRDKPSGSRKTNGGGDEDSNDKRRSDRDERDKKSNRETIQFERDRGRSDKEARERRRSDKGDGARDKDRRRSSISHRDDSKDKKRSDKDREDHRSSSRKRDEPRESSSSSSRRPNDDRKRSDDQRSYRESSRRRPTTDAIEEEDSRKRSGSRSNRSSAEERRKLSATKEAERQRSGESRPTSQRSAKSAEKVKAPNNEEEEEHKKNKQPAEEEEDEIAEEEEEEEERGDGDNYDDDDFEDYDDDDFEDETEEEEEVQGEQKMDSGNYDRRTAYERARMDQEMKDVKQAMVRENSARHPRQARRGEAASSKSDDSGNGSPKEEEEVADSKPKRPQSSKRGFINFSSAKQRQKTQLVAGKARARGDELLTMIRLDVVAFELMELPPIRYEAFMKTFGATNTMQAMAQTGDDNLEEEVQTEAVETLEKWTQKPAAAVSFKDLEDGDTDLMLQSIRGVGGQMGDKYGRQNGAGGSWEFSSRSDSMRLSKFLKASVPALLTLLEEEAIGDGPAGQLNKDVEFSDNVSLLNTDLPYLLDRPVTCLAFAPDQPSILLTAHGPLPEDEEHNPSPEKTTILCVWKVSQPSAPNKVLVANGDVVHCNFSPHKASLVFAGFADGMICAWDLRESLSVHQEVVKEDDGDDVFRSPTFATHSAEEGHSSAVTAIKPLPEAQECN